MADGAALVRRYYTLADALRAADALPVFAVDKANPKTPGCKDFRVCTFRTAYDTLARTPPDQRCWYEIIKAGQPCHLYIDAECERCPENAAIDFDELDTLLRTHLETLTRTAAYLDPDCTARPFADTPATFRVVCLRSHNSPRKESRHYVLHIEGADGTAYAFADAYHVGALVRHLHADPERAAPFLVWQPKQQRRASYIDLGVYTKNRNYRLPMCSKRGDVRPLLPLGTAADAALDLATFLDACVTHIAHPRLLYTREPATGATPHSTSWLPPVGVPAALWDEPRAPRALTQPPPHARPSPLGVAWCHRAADTLAAHWEHVHRLAHGSTHPQPVSLTDDGQLVVATRQRHCAIAARTHSHNNIFFVVDATRWPPRWRQRCFSPHGCQQRRAAWHDWPAPDDRELARALEEWHDRKWLALDLDHLTAALFQSS